MNPKLYWINGPWPGGWRFPLVPVAVTGWKTRSLVGVAQESTPSSRCSHLTKNNDLQLREESRLAETHGLRFVSPSD